jgi:hypothetical protein
MDYLELYKAVCLDLCESKGCWVECISQAMDSF